MSSASDVLNKITGVVQIGALVEGNVVPIIIGTVKEVQSLIQGETIEYTVALSTGQDQLNTAAQNFTAALEAINAERAKAVPPLPPLDIPTV